MSEIHPRILRTDAGPKRLAKSGAVAGSVVEAAAKMPDGVAVAKSQARRAARRKIALAVVLGVSVLCYVGQQRRPIGPSAGTLDVRAVVAAVPAGQSALLKLGTYNIHGGKGTDGRTDLERIAGVIRGLDFVGLNEVLGPALGEKEDQAAALAKQLKMTSLYTPTEERWWQAKFGNGLLTKLDVRSYQVVPLERRHGKSYRNFVHVRAKAANGVPLNLVVTHIDRSDDRERHEQLTTVIEYFKSLEKPAVLLGDLNTDEHEPVMVKLLDKTDIVDALAAAKGFHTPRHIDWVLTRGLEVKEAGMSPVGPSDHAHVWAELMVPPTVPTVGRRAWDLPFEFALEFPPDGQLSKSTTAVEVHETSAASLAAAVADAGLDSVREYPSLAPSKSVVVNAIDNVKGFHVPWRIDDSLGQCVTTKLSLQIGSADRAPSTQLLDLVNDSARWGRFEAPPMTAPERVRWNQSAGGVVIDR